MVGEYNRYMLSKSNKKSEIGELLLKQENLEDFWMKGDLVYNVNPVDYDQMNAFNPRLLQIQYLFQIITK